MRKILYILHRYPQMSETYMETEIRALRGRFEIEILTTGKPDLSYEWHHPYTALAGTGEIIQAAMRARPDVIHGHYTQMIPLIAQAARRAGVPFTLRTHSFDVFGPAQEKLPAYREEVNGEHCAGILGFPPTLELFARAGWDMRKIVSCFPIIEYDWFYDRSPNGDAIMNVGACIPKKKMDDFVQLGRSMPDKTFNLYALGYYKGRIEKLNAEMGNPVRVIPPVQPRAMPAEYKKHQWLVYTGNTGLPTVGWPLAVAEAQASGVGVCMCRVRPDLEEYLGGAGHLFDTIEEAASIIRNPVPDEMREAGFAQAAKSDIHAHVDRLVDLWRRAYSRDTGSGGAARSPGSG